MEYFGTSLNEHGHYMFDLSGDYMKSTYRKFETLPFNPEQMTNGLKKGETAFYQGGGYTVISISGSCTDTRPGTKSTFWVKEIISKNELVDRMKNNELASKIINAMPFDVLF